MEDTVDGKPCRLTVDTGAERTLARADVVTAQQLPDAQRQFRGVTGHCVQLKGPVEVRIGIGSIEEELPVYVANMEECLLGLDYLEQNEACVDLRRKSLRLRGEAVPLLPEDDCAEVVTAERVRFAPRTEARIQCRLSRTMRGADGVVEPAKDMQLAEGVAVGRSLVGDGEHYARVCGSLT